MLSPELTNAIAGFLAGDAPRAHLLDRLVKLLPQLLPGCAAAAAARWRDGIATDLAASGRSVANLVASDLEQGSGPAADARSGHVWCPDTRHAGRWPGFRADAARAGVRSLAAVASRSGPETTTVILYGARRRSIGIDAAAFAALLVAGSAAPPGDGPRPAHAAARSPGHRGEPSALAPQQEAERLLMRALGAGRPEARDLLKAISPACESGGGDVARWLLSEHARAAAEIQAEAGAADAPDRPDDRAGAARRARARTLTGTAGIRRAVPRTRVPADPPDPGRPRPLRSPASSRPASGGTRPAPSSTRPARGQQLARLARQVSRLRRDLAVSAASLARTEAALAETLEGSARNLPGYEKRLRDKAAVARRCSADLGSLASAYADGHPALSRAGNRPARPAGRLWLVPH